MRRARLRLGCSLTPHGRRTVAWAERGNSLVEYALMIVPFFVLVMGSLDLGRAVFYHHLLTTAAKDAARTGIAAGRTAPAMCTSALRVASSGMPGVSPTTDCSTAGPSTPVNAGPLRITVTRPVPSTSPQYAAAQLTYAFRPITPLIATVIGATGGTVTLTATSSMFIETE